VIWLWFSGNTLTERYEAGLVRKGDGERAAVEGGERLFPPVKLFISTIPYKSSLVIKSWHVIFNIVRYE
jgi:hypothetical protein